MELTGAIGMSGAILTARVEVPGRVMYSHM